jgi:hypothetical protein
MRLLTVAVLLFGGACAGGGSSPPGPPVRLAGDISDTIIVNSRLLQRLPVHAFDAQRRIVVGAPIRFERTEGADVPIASVGGVKCTKSGDVTVRAVLDSLTTRLVVRCRPVDTVQIQGPIQFVLGDSELGRPRAFPLGVYGADGRPVALFTASIFLLDSGVAQLRGTTIYPRLRGVSLVQVNIGDHEGATGVHIYQRVGGLEALDTLLRVHPGRRQFAVPLHMGNGTQYRQWLPPGGWMLTLLPREEDGSNPIRMFVDGAACDSNILNDPGRLGCSAGSRASVIVYRPFSPRAEAPASAYLLVRGLSFGKDPGHFVPRVRAISAALVCVKDFLGARGYALWRASAADHLMQMNRVDGQLGTPARRERIEVRFVAEDSTLRARAWAVDSYPSVDPRLNDENPIQVAPAEETLTAAREALQQCRRR